MTFLRPLRCANSKAYSAILREAYLVVILMDSITPGYTSCSMPEYSPKDERDFTLSVLPNDCDIRVLVPLNDSLDREGERYVCV